MLEVLLHHDKLPAELVKLQEIKDTLAQNLARVADEMERLYKVEEEYKKLKKKVGLSTVDYWDNAVDFYDHKLD